MAIFSRILIAGVLAAGIGAQATAQGAPVALSQAQARLACGTGIVLGAITLPSGEIEVTCEATAAGQVPAALAGALTPQIAAGIAGVVFIAVLVGGGGTSETQTAGPAASAGSGSAVD